METLCVWRSVALRGRAVVSSSIFDDYYAPDRNSILDTLHTLYVIRRHQRLARLHRPRYMHTRVVYISRRVASRLWLGGEVVSEGSSSLPTALFMEKSFLWPACARGTDPVSLYNARPCKSARRATSIIFHSRETLHGKLAT